MVPQQLHFRLRQRRPDRQDPSINFKKHRRGTLSISEVSLRLAATIDAGMNNIYVNIVMAIIQTENGGTVLNYLLRPITPEAIGLPLLPFYLD